MPNLRLPRNVIARIANNIPEAIRAFEQLFDGLDIKQDTLVSGENIKTINGQSILGGGNLVVEITSIDWTAVDNTPTTLAGYGILDAATLTDLALKQDSLVSGTNIKTINGNTLLGSGDLVVGGATGGTAVISFGAAPGTNIAEVAVVGQIGIGAGALVRAWVQGDTTSDHNSYEHSRIIAGNVSLSCEAVSAGVGFAIVASTQLRLTGDVQCRWEWV